MIRYCYYCGKRMTKRVGDRNGWSAMHFCSMVCYGKHRIELARETRQKIKANRAKLIKLPIK